MTTETEPVVPAALLEEMRTYAATLRGSQAAGALKLIDHFDRAKDREDAPLDHWCAHGSVFFGHDCGECDAEAGEPHPFTPRTFVNPTTRRRVIRCHRCRGYQSNYRHTGGS